MSQRVQDIINVMQLIRSWHRQNPNASITGFRKFACVAVAQSEDRSRKVDKNTVRDHLRMGHPPPGISFYDLDPLIENWLRHGSNDLGMRYLEWARESEKVMLRDFFSSYEIGLTGKLLSELDSETAKNIKRGKYGQGGESREHRQLKDFIAQNPAAIGLPEKFKFGKTEYVFPSRDSIDVLFTSNDEWVGVEVKSTVSGLEDVERGLYQCVKYQALLRAVIAVSELGVTSRVLLATNGRIPEVLYSIRNTLRVKAVEIIYLG